MFELEQTVDANCVERLTSQGYWPACAATALKEGKYSRVVEICREHLPSNPRVLSARLLYARALYLTHQLDVAAEQFRQVLSIDPDNLSALKTLGDIHFAQQDEAAAIANYQRAQQLDPYWTGLKSDLAAPTREETTTLTLKHRSEPGQRSVHANRGHKIQFHTETMGDLYLSQGHPRLAVEVYRTVGHTDQNPRLAEKLRQAEKQISEKGT
ncbi:MAG: tetratricopeptide repeat protein [Candidatus Zixiibacteriota bacterium]